MFQFNIDFYKKLQFYAISQLRQNEDYLNLCKIVGDDFNNLKDVAQYLLNSRDIEVATGVWLDYIGWLVGTSRGYFDITKFFCVNSDDINAEKFIWFPDQTVEGDGSLGDDTFRKRIYAKIGYNTSRGTRNENNHIIKNMTNAKRVIIKRVAPMTLDITLIGNAINETFAAKENLERVLADGVGIRNIIFQGE